MLSSRNPKDTGWQIRRDWCDGQFKVRQRNQLLKNKQRKSHMSSHYLQVEYKFVVNKRSSEFFQFILYYTLLFYHLHFQVCICQAELTDADFVQLDALPVTNLCLFQSMVNSFSQEITNSTTCMTEIYFYN